jgi:hypothetical protein
MWAADNRRDLIRASDYPTSGAWLVTIEGVTVGSVQPTYSGARAKRWTALINGMSVLGGRARCLLRESYQDAPPPVPAPCSSPTRANAAYETTSASPAPTAFSQCATEMTA